MTLCKRKLCCEQLFYIFRLLTRREYGKQDHLHINSRVDDSSRMVMIWDDFSSCPKGLSVHSARNPSFIRELLTYEVMEEDALAIGMVAQDEPFIFVRVNTKKSATKSVF